MNLMLMVIFLCVGLGLLAPRLGRREHIALGLLAVAMTTIYYLFPNRFM